MIVIKYPTFSYPLSATILPSQATVAISKKQLCKSTIAFIMYANTTSAFENSNLIKGLLVQKKLGISQLTIAICFVCNSYIEHPSNPIALTLICSLSLMLYFLMYLRYHF